MCPSSVALCSRVATFHSLTLRSSDAEASRVFPSGERTTPQLTGSRPCAPEVLRHMLTASSTSHSFGLYASSDADAVARLFPSGENDE